MESDLLRLCWFLAGPTACGKTALSLSLAERLNAEIIALDSMTIYRGMDIGTAKPSSAEQARVRHHLIDIRDPHEEFSLAEYISIAEGACREIISRDKTPLFVGGTGLYLRGLLRGVFQGPEADWALRNELEERGRKQGTHVLHDELQRIDPVTSARLHPNDIRRVIRAIEVFQLTGQPLSTQQEQRPRPPSERSQNVYWLSPPRNWLYARIDARVEQMFADGLLEEVQRLRGAVHPLSHTARQALGYKEILDWLEQHEPDRHTVANVSLVQRTELIKLIQTRTRQFAKRQHTWFRNLEECLPIKIEGVESANALAGHLVQSGSMAPSA